MFCCCCVQTKCSNCVDNTFLIYICQQLCSKSDIHVHSDKVRDIIDGQKEVDTAIDFLHTTSKLSHSSTITSGWFSAVWLPL